MKAYEFPCKVTPEGRLELPEALTKLLPANQVVRVIILLNEPTERRRGSMGSPHRGAILRRL
jgi:hypothetical protein